MESLSKWAIEHAAEQGFLVVLLLVIVGFLSKYISQLNTKIDKVQSDFLKYVAEDHERTIELLEETKNALINNTRIMERFLERGLK